MTKKPTDTTSGQRGKHVRVKTAKGRTTSQQRWLSRQLNDPYIRRAKAEGYRSRAAYKLTEIDDKFGILKPGCRVVDLGAAPGSWTQVAIERIGKKGKIIGIDLLEVEPIEGVTMLVGDFREEAMLKTLEAMLEGKKVHVVMSDMAANTTGHTQTDHIRIMDLCGMALEFAIDWLAPEGAFVAKVLRGGTEGEMLTRMKQHFTTVKHVKPAASRADSAEMYVVALGFKG
jgi:23S rRNA (uridine2552-2'-O)-methyltransferase